MFVQIERLTKRYGGFTALDDCTLSIEKGEVFGLLGPNGAGKTTLLRLLLGYIEPTCGTVTVDGIDCYRLSHVVHRLVAYLPGDVRLFGNMRALDAIHFLGEMRCAPTELTDYRRRAQLLATQLELDTSRRVAYMSTGTRQKVALVATFAANAPLIVLDEPTSNLDPTMRSRIADLVRQAKSNGQTVIFSSHVLSEVEDVGDRIAILRAGRTVHMQEMSAVRSRHRICALLQGPRPAPPDELQSKIEIVDGLPNEFILETGEELMPIVRWLAQLELRDLRIEPAGIRSIYHRYHPAQNLERVS